MTEREELIYMRGRRSAYADVLSVAVRNLDMEGREQNGWMIERAETVAMLREICERHGDNDWPDTLHLADVIEKHLWNHFKD